MRVVHFSTDHSPYDVRIFLKECRTLAAAGYEVHFLAPGATDELRDGVRLHDIGKPDDLSRVRRVWRRLSNAFHRAAALGGDVYHFHDPELIPVGLLLKQRGARVIYDVHELAPMEARVMSKDRPINGFLKSWAWSAYEDAARQSLDAFVCAVPALMDRFPADRSILLQNYPMLGEFAFGELGRHASRPRTIVYAGGITAVRGIREIVAALALLPGDCECKLILMGSCAADLLAELRFMPGWTRVDYRGWQSREQMTAEMAQSRAGLLLFHPEPDHLLAAPNKMYEYVAAGLPLIASNFPAWRSLIERNGFGVTVNPLDPRAIADAIASVLDQPERGQVMGEAGRAAVQREFNWEAESAKLLALYRSLETR